jgi:hypothetical protein
LEAGLSLPRTDVRGGDENHVRLVGVHQFGRLVHRLGESDHLDQIPVDPCEELSGERGSSYDEQDPNRLIAVVSLARGIG